MVASAASLVLWSTLLVRVPAEPFSIHQRACVSGQLCAVSDIAGTGLSNGDRLLLAVSRCGIGPRLAGMPGALGETLPAIGDGTQMTWPSHITPDGGDYTLCWCSSASRCDRFSKFTFEVGILTVTGPIAGMTKACTSGRECLIDGLRGTLLRDGDTIMVLNTCGGSPIDGFPNSGKTTTGNYSGTQHGWGSEPIRAVGGSYALCWCSQSASCVDGQQHRKSIGTLVVTGPAGNFTKVCNTLAACTWQGLAGSGLADGDRIMILNSCGQPPAILGFPNGAEAVASGGGKNYAFEASGTNVIEAGGGTYAMCWCSTNSGLPCDSPVDFLTRAGTLTVQGPRRDHVLSCIQGLSCQVMSLGGVGLSSNDRLRAKIVCDSANAPAGFSNGGIVAPLDAGSNYAAWASVTAAYGNYRLCWCGLGWTCDNTGFKMDAGELRVVGINSGQDRTCHVLAGCRVSGLTGFGLRAKDLMMVRTSCSSTLGGQVPGWPNTGVSEPATLAGSQFSWGLTSRVLTPPGTYKMCWCPLDHYAGCSSPAHFTVEVGDISLQGPVRFSKNASCVAYQTPSCIVGPFQHGFGLQPGTDYVSLLSPGGTCGVDALDPRLTGVSLVQKVEADGLAAWPPEALAYGGDWKICYCANYDSPIDSDFEPCSSTQDFAGEVGILFVRGAFLDQGVNCTRNQVCSFSIKGYDLDKDTNMIALRPGDARCGATSALDTASAPGNPYPAVRRVDDNHIIFKIGPIQSLATFHMCYCVPAAAGDFCSSSNLRDFVQEIGFFDVRGASASQTWECGTGGQCKITVRGRHLSYQDRVKIIGENGTCVSSAAIESGFFRPLAPADPFETTDTYATFSLGRVFVTGVFKVCYCAAVGGCDGMDEYNHDAGMLSVLNPLNSLRFVSATAAYMIVAVDSFLTGQDSRVRCAVSIYEPRSIPTVFDISDGLSVVGLGKGEAEHKTRVGANLVKVFFNTWVRSNQQYRVWCTETAAQSFVLPNHAGGILIITPSGITHPRSRTFPSFLWQNSRYYIELFEVYDEVLDASRAATQARVSSAPSEELCQVSDYDAASPMQVEDAGQEGSKKVMLLAKEMLQASRWQRFICYFAEPNATGIAMLDDELQVQATMPTFSKRRVSGQVMQRFYRGVSMQVIFSGTATGSKGLLHWTNTAGDCRTVNRNPPAAQVINGPNTSYFRFSDPVGTYEMCYLANQADVSTPAPFNGLGTFEVADVITAIQQQSRLPSTRSTVRLQLEVRLPGTATCLVAAGETDVAAADFAGIGSFEGRGILAVPLPDEGVDPEFPRMFGLNIPLVRYQRTKGPVHVWCHHSAAEGLVFPANNRGVLIPLQVEEASVMSLPPFLWDGARFHMRLSGTPLIDSKRLTMHEPALPTGWRKEMVTEQGLRKLKYISGTTETEEHPVYTLWKDGKGASPCKDSNTSQAVNIRAEDYTRTDTWFLGKTVSSFVCYWPMPNAYPHLLGVLPIIAQPPVYELEVAGEMRSFVYRGVPMNIHLKHGAPAGGRLMVVRKYIFDNFGGACQEFPELRYRRLSRRPMRRLGKEWPWPRQSRRLQQCTQAARSTAELRLEAIERLFPDNVWGQQQPTGLNCSRDYKIYHHPDLVNVSILADIAVGSFLLVTSSAAALEQILPNVGILSPNGGVPTGEEAIVAESFSGLNNYSSALQWTFSMRDCRMQKVLGKYSPMYAEGAEDLPLTQYLEAALVLDGLDMAGLIFLPRASTVAQRKLVCDLMQPPAPAPVRPETVFDIDLAGYGRTVVDGKVWVPSKVNGTGTFLHTDPLQEYVLCYLGQRAKGRRLNHLSPRYSVLNWPLFNPVGETFSSRDVLTLRDELGENRSHSVRGFVNVESDLLGMVRCVSFLRNVIPPGDPDQLFHPDQTSEDYAGSSEPIEYTTPGERKVVTIRLDQTRARLLAPQDSYAGAPPTMHVWCAHEASTVVYPYNPGGFAVRLQARPPPIFEYRQLKKVVTELHLTLQLQFSPVTVHWGDPVFPVNSHDEAQFLSRPAMPKGLVLDPKTGRLTGVPEELVGGEIRSILAASLWPPYAQTSVDLKIQVDDVLGLRFTHVNAERVTLTTRPRTTNVFEPQQVFFLTRAKIQSFTYQPDEFTCVNALAQVEFTNNSALTCSANQGVCCCAGFLLPHQPVQDARITRVQCGWTADTVYHTRAMVQGLLMTAEDTRVPARLASTYEVEFSLPEEVAPEEKFPVLFDLVLNMSLSEYRSRQAYYTKALIQEISRAIGVPEELVQVSRSSGMPDGAVRLEISFYVEPRCMEAISAEIQIISFGIDTREGCSFVSPTEFMIELKAQLFDRNSALFYRSDLSLLHEVQVGRSFSYAKVMHFCNRDPFWQYAAVVEEAADCPLDPIKLGVTGLIGGTVVLMTLLALLSHCAHQCAVMTLLGRTRAMDLLTPLLGLYTVMADYAWLFMLRSNSVHSLHDILFTALGAQLATCFIMNFLALRVTVLTHIQDTPWWRRNRKRLRLLMFVCCFNPRVLRVTRSCILGLDWTNIHFGTPSKMSIVLSNLGLFCLVQDFPQLLVQLYVWLIWRNAGPKIALFGIALNLQSILTAFLHHVFSRSQRSAYENVVKLLGVRRLTAGFFDVSAAGQQVGNLVQLENMRRADGRGPISLADEEDDDELPTTDLADPSKLDPIQAALYVSKMYEKEQAKANEDSAHLDKASDDSDEAEMLEDLSSGDADR